MASAKFEEFDIVNGQWENYIERFVFFLDVNGVIEPTKQRAIFYAVCGGALYDLVKSLIVPKATTEVSLIDVCDRLREHFCPEPNEIIESFKFHKRHQGREESMNEYIANLRKMSKYCNFLDLDRTLRDRLVCGVRDVKLQELLLRESHLTYNRAIHIALAAEQRGLQIKVIHSSQPDDPGTSYSEPMEVNKMVDRKQMKKYSCYRCGSIEHQPKQCRFLDSVCRYCQKKGHIESACRLKKNNGKKQAIYDIEETDELNLMNSLCARLNSIPDRVELSHNRVPPMRISVSIEDIPISLEVDSGTGYTIISERQARQIWPDKLPKLDASTLTLRTWTNDRVQLLGVISVGIRYKKARTILPLLIAQGHGQALLGRNWFAPLKIKLEGINSIVQSNTKSTTVDAIIEKYSEVFSGGLGTYRGPKVTIKVNSAMVPKFLKCRPIPFAIRDRVAAEIDRLVEIGVLEPIKYSQWATPIVPVVKKSGEIRLCGDYRATVNMAIDSDTYPLPTANEALSAIADATIFSKLDLEQAFTQVSVDDDTSTILTLNTLKGLFRVKRLPFGVKASPGIFQRLMSTTLAAIPGTSVLLDDILIAGRNEKEHNDRLEEVLKRLRNVGLKLNRNKCKLATSTVSFLGFIVDEQGIHPSSEKVDAINNAKPPQNVKELQAFLGLVNFYERFMPNKATILAPLHRLLTKEYEWRWNTQENNSFQKAKNMLTGEETLMHFDNNRRVTLTCDASPYGVGAVLAHSLDDGQEKPVAFGSRTLNKHERNYSQIDKEAAAIIFGLEKFHQYVYGRHIEIFTDHKPLLGIFSPNKEIPRVLSPRMLRWALTLSSYSYDLTYRSGASMGNADALSRWPEEGCSDFEDDCGDILLISETPSPLLYSTKSIADMTSSNAVLAKVKHWILHGWPERLNDEELRNYWLKRDELSISNDCVIWGTRVVVPPPMRDYMLSSLHESHAGMVISKSIARSYFWWPGLDHDIESMIAKCDKCQVKSNMPAKTSHSWIMPTNPWQRVHIDFAGPYRGKMFLVLVDAHSRWPEVKIVPSIGSKKVIQTLREIFCEQGLPEVLVSDNGTSFTSEEFKKFLKNNGIRHIVSPPYHPASNGHAERTVQTIKAKLEKFASYEWEEILPRILFALRTTPSSATGKSPAEVLNKRRFRTRFDFIHPLSARTSTDKEIESNQAVPLRKFQLGGMVWCRNYSRGAKWLKGVIMKIKGPARFVVRTENNLILIRHVNQIRKRVDSEDIRNTLGIPIGARVSMNDDIIDQ